MKVLAVHNQYQRPGGEDAVFEAETAMLEAHGNEVVRYTTHNNRVDEFNKMNLARIAIWNNAASREIRALIRREKPAVMHVHNTLPLISPAVYHVARAEGVGVVQSLHNYRLLCPSALLFRDTHVCEDCLGRAIPWPGVVHGCYRDSRAATGVVAAMLATHWALGTWTDAVDTYIAMSEFARRKFVQGGMPQAKIAVKPNFVAPDPGVGDHSGGYALFVGRHSAEKGLQTLLEAWKELDDIPLKIAGGIPPSEVVKSSPGSVTWVGRPPKDEVTRLMQDAAVLVFPSEVYEGFPVTIAEAFATGLPVVASRLGAMIELIDHDRTGAHFTPGDAADLRRVMRRVFTDPDRLRRLSRGARADFEQKYTCERNYEILSGIYRSALPSHATGSVRAQPLRP
ncbi:MAG: glycosyl transferase family 1 [Acidobacteria bacterium RIFCSPLOWO2_12_FULL_67_14]|nr:MAG: glycosyl transferase family 1 [Acidobacteria bacterium RIFCSPLOWO2_02_FULL_67_21]OFW38047.1 MAG: glycosyl transferase family 1 [Acidobacteria bacterium RIFCSPLOWO2_12_FULL_67_14]